jgi:hypothetical protein
LVFGHWRIGAKDQVPMTIDAWMSRWMNAQERYLGEVAATYPATEQSGPSSYALQCDQAKLAFIRAVFENGDVKLRLRCAQWLMLEYMEVAEGTELDEEDAREVQWIRSELAMLERNDPRN